MGGAESDPGRILYFAYGSNLDIEQMRQRCPSSRPHVRGVLENHRIDFTHRSRRWGGGAADVVAQAEESVWGALYSLERSELELLDRFEGGYERLEIQVHAEKSGPVHALTYTVRIKGSFLPTREYLEKLLRWGEHWDFPEAYLSHLRGIQPIR